MDVEGNKAQFTLGVQQLMVQPALEYRVYR